MAPRVSVLMPVYNRARYVRTAIESILTQSYRSFELVIVDDGSTDGTVDEVRSFRDERLRLVENGTNRGIAFSRNRALRESWGEMVAWLDSDDVCLPDRLEAQAVALDARPEAGLCYTDLSEIDYEGRPVVGGLRAGADLPAEWQLLWTNPIAQSSVMFRRGLVSAWRDPYRVGLNLSEDYDLWTRLSRLTSFCRIPRVLVLHRTLAESAFNRSPKGAFLAALEANYRHIEGLTGLPPPPFHKFLTSFGGVLDEEMNAVSLETLRAWYGGLARILAAEQRWSPEVREKVDFDIRNRLRAVLISRLRVFLAWRTLRDLVMHQPVLLVSTACFWLYRVARSRLWGAVKRKALTALKR